VPLVNHGGKRIFFRIFLPIHEVSEEFEQKLPARHHAGSGSSVAREQQHPSDQKPVGHPKRDVSMAIVVVTRLSVVIVRSRGTVVIITASIIIVPVIIIPIIVPVVVVVPVIIPIIAVATTIIMELEARVTIPPVISGCAALLATALTSMSIHYEDFFSRLGHRFLRSWCAGFHE
jgi:hypothetical protein